MNIFSFLVVGLIAGWLAGKIMKGGGFGLIGNLIVGVVGAVTHDLPSLVSPAGISNLTIGDPVKAVNAEARAVREAQLRKLNDDQG